MYTPVYNIPKFVINDNGSSITIHNLRVAMQNASMYGERIVLSPKVFRALNVIFVNYGEVHSKLLISDNNANSDFITDRFVTDVLCDYYISFPNDKYKHRQLYLLSNYIDDGPIDMSPTIMEPTEHKEINGPVNMLQPMSVEYIVNGKQLSSFSDQGRVPRSKRLNAF